MVGQGYCEHREERAHAKDDKKAQRTDKKTSFFASFESGGAVAENWFGNG